MLKYPFLLLSVRHLKRWLTPLPLLQLLQPAVHAPDLFLHHRHPPCEMIVLPDLPGQLRELLIRYRLGRPVAQKHPSSVTQPVMAAVMISLMSHSSGGTAS